jgi:hypothetical protein
MARVLTCKAAAPEDPDKTVAVAEGRESTMDPTFEIIISH